MNTKNIFLIILFVLIAFAIGFFVFKKTNSQSEKTKVIKVDTNDWAVFSNEVYGYEMWCPKDFDCRYVCKNGDLANEQFCANIQNDPTNQLYITQIPLKEYGTGQIIVNFADKSFTLNTNSKNVLTALKAELSHEGFKVLDGSRFLITGVAEIVGFNKKLDPPSNPDYIEQWYFVKNNFLYSGKITIKDGENNFNEKLQKFE